MTAAGEFTVRDFVNLVKELNEHEAELKIKLAKAGVSDRAEPAKDGDEKQGG
jgi:hypothetical protein